MRVETLSIDLRPCKIIPDDLFDRCAPLFFFCFVAFLFAIISLFEYYSSVICKIEKVIFQYISHVTRKREKKEISSFVFWLEEGKTKKRKFFMSGSQISHFFRISSYGQFPDHRIRFCEKGINKHLEFYDRKTLQMSKT